MTRRAARLAAAAPEATAGQLRAAVEGLMGALDEGADAFPVPARTAAERTLDKAATRLTFVGAHTVVAFVGATGSGKSSLFNRLVGEEVAAVGELRPTTRRSSAAVWGHDDAGPLLDWLQVRSRHQVQPGRRARSEGERTFEGLVLLDLPDVDSDVAAHRVEADRVLGLADVFVWVTDPQKYADALLHDEYLTAARHHQTVTLVVLNQADRMRSDLANACRDDLRRLLAADGLPDTEVLLVSAKSGQGLPELAEAVAGAVKAADAARVRLLGDVRSRAETLREHVADTEPEIPANLEAELIGALGRSAGVPVVLDAVERDYRRRARFHTGWWFGRWVQRLRPDPLARLGLGRGTRAEAGVRGAAASVDPGGDVATLVERSAVPQAPPTARAAVDLAIRRLGVVAADGLPEGWRACVERIVMPDQAHLADALDQAILAAPIRRVRPLWWLVFNAMQWLCAFAAVGGAIWALTMVMLQLPVPESWRVGIVPAPTLLAVLGLVLGLLLAVLAGPLVRVGARRRRAGVQRVLSGQIAEVTRERLIAPVRAALVRHARTRDHLNAALGR
ncbi:MAG TPA: GTPase [Dermatophilaceae bacterium]|nr:GTPase [Dermatophilaceae bacterium]